MFSFTTSGLLIFIFLFFWKSKKLIFNTPIVKLILAFLKIKTPP